MTQANVRAQIDQIEREMTAEWGAQGCRRLHMVQEELMCAREWQVTPRRKKALVIALERAWWALRRFVERAAATLLAAQP